VRVARPEGAGTDGSGAGGDGAAVERGWCRGRGREHAWQRRAGRVVVRARVRAVLLTGCMVEGWVVRFGRCCCRGDDDAGAYT
jgi:hypothetical protein